MHVMKHVQTDTSYIFASQQQDAQVKMHYSCNEAYTDLTHHIYWGQVSPLSATAASEGQQGCPSENAFLLVGTVAGSGSLPKQDCPCSQWFLSFSKSFESFNLQILSQVPTKCSETSRYIIPFFLYFDIISSIYFIICVVAPLMLPLFRNLWMRKVRSIHDQRHRLSARCEQARDHERSGTPLETNGWNTIIEVFFQTGLVTRNQEDSQTTHS